MTASSPPPAGVEDCWVALSSYSDRLIPSFRRMPEASLVPEFLKDFALKRNFAVHDCVYGSINLGRSFPIEQSCGAVMEYGPVPHTIRTGLVSIPGYPQWYPVYWQGHHASQPFEGMSKVIRMETSICQAFPNWRIYPGLWFHFAAHYDEFEFAARGLSCRRHAPGRRQRRESACLIARAPGQWPAASPACQGWWRSWFLDGQWGAAMDMSRGHRCLPPVRVQFLSMEPDARKQG